jgi:hypothetical protein
MARSRREIVTLQDALEATGTLIPRERFEDVRRHIDPAWVAEALEATGTATVRKRRLPAEQVVWLVIGMALFRKWPIHDLVGHLDLVLPGPKPTVVPSAVAEARARLGGDPVERLFETTARKWVQDVARKQAWRGLGVYAVDGSTLRIADSDENRAHFGVSSSQRGTSGYPLVRLVALMAVRTHLLASVAYGPYASGELKVSESIWRQVPDHSLVIVDRQFLAANILVPLARDGRHRHWLTRAKTKTRWTVLKSLSKNEDLVEIEISDPARKGNPSLPLVYQARAIRYQRPGFSPQVLLTSLLDPVAYPAKEVIALYHERWEIELGYDEIKTEMLDRLETIRSRTVAGVEQELWGIFLAYNLVRLEMQRIAADLGVRPTQISFVAALRLICETWAWCAIASPGAIPTRLRTMREIFPRLVLPDRRTTRQYPRAVKLKMSHFDRKRRPDAVA